MRARKICISIISEDNDLLQISGYIAKYYTKEKINIFDKEVDYTLENMNHIEKLFEELTKKDHKVFYNVE